MSAEDDDALFAEARRILREEGLPEGGLVFDGALVPDPSGSTGPPGEDEARPPSITERRHRAVVCAAVAARALNEREGTNLDAARVGLLDWVEGSGAAVALEPREVRVLTSEPGGIEDAELTDAAWRTEGAAVLAWALGVMELPEPGELADPGTVFGALGLADPDLTESILDGGAPRTDAEIADLHDRLRFLHGELHREIEGPDAVDERILRIRSITVERQRAAAWLLRGGSFEDTDVSPEGYSG